MPRKRPKTYEEQRLSRIRMYGIDVPDYDRMLEEQGGGCYVCGKEPEERKALHIDHDHDTGKVRGLLCANHNRGLGLFNDDPMLIIKTLEYLVRNYDRQAGVDSVQSVPSSQGDCSCQEASRAEVHRRDEQTGQ